MATATSYHVAIGRTCSRREAVAHTTLRGVGVAPARRDASSQTSPDVSSSSSRHGPRYAPAETATGLCVGGGLRGLATDPPRETVSVRVRLSVAWLPVAQSVAAIDQPPPLPLTPPLIAQPDLTGISCSLFSHKLHFFLLSYWGTVTCTG
ncbi:hypothetical protein J6590_041498 [Homalodisca vitripennis]|nr:hypothetical protein J6590_041498 [Homalodisca vitripennis]